MAILSGGEIKKRQKAIFQSGFDLNSVEAASYNLRLNDVNLVIDGNVYTEKNKYDYTKSGGYIKLPPKKISVLSTIEELNLSDDLCARVGITFSYSRKGLIPLFGPQIDPGYKGTFYAVVYNTSDKEILLERGAKIFKMEIHEIVGDPRVNSSQKRHTMEDFLIELRELTQEETVGFKRLNELEKKLGEIVDRVEEIKSGYMSIFWFGILLISSTMFGVFYSFLLSSLGNVKKLGTLWGLIPLSVMAILFAIGWGVTVWAAYRHGGGVDKIKGEK